MASAVDPVGGRRARPRAVSPTLAAAGHKSTATSAVSTARQRGSPLYPTLVIRSGQHPDGQRGSRRSSSPRSSMVSAWPTRGVSGGSSRAWERWMFDAARDRTVSALLLSPSEWNHQENDPGCDQGAAKAKRRRGRLKVDSRFERVRPHRLTAARARASRNNENGKLFKWDGCDAAELGAVMLGRELSRYVRDPQSRRALESAEPSCSAPCRTNPRGNHSRPSAVQNESSSCLI